MPHWGTAASYDAEMPPEVPIIFTPVTEPIRLSLRGRVVAAGIALACLAVLLVAAYLEPDPAGWGRETRLGMRPCGFLERTGLPCAACGMTTSFNHFVRFEWLKSLWVQPMGFLLAVATGATFWAAAYVAITARPAHRLLKRLPPVKLTILAVSLGLLAWGWKMALTLAEVAGTNW